MDTYLLTIAIGPVQTLIESARRTRDLWCGSWILSECAKAAALSLHNAHSGSLIFPNLDKPDSDLIPKDFDDRYANISNVIRAEISTDSPNELKQLAASAKQAARDRLIDIGDKTQKSLNGFPIRSNLWDSQINDTLESFAVWVKVENSNYADAVKRLNSLLQTRKNSRDFSAITIISEMEEGLPKSSLDGARESVINLQPWQRKDIKNRRHIRKLGLSNGEELDSLGVLKRLAGEVEQFSPYPRICADDWITTVMEQEQKDALSRIKDAYSQLEEGQKRSRYSDRVSTQVKGNNGIYDDFPYDGELLYDFRLQNALGVYDQAIKRKNPEISEEEKKEIAKERELLENLSSALASIKTKPVPYGVILKADGDRMGDLFAQAKSADQSRQISKTLHDFASDVRRIVQEHRGHAIYAGGDDVLAMLPLSTAIDCANQLQDEFHRVMASVIDTLKITDLETPTLSVGIAIGHFMQPLGHLRARAIRAEKLAKGDDQVKEKQRNALGICLGLRSGSEVTWRCQWTEKENLDAFLNFQNSYTGTKKETISFKKNAQQQEKEITSTLPSRAGFAIRSVALRYHWSQDESATISPIQQAELTRLLDNLQQKGGVESITPGMKKALQKQADQVGLSDLANQLIIARWLSAKTQSDLGAME